MLHSLRFNLDIINLDITLYAKRHFYNVDEELKWHRRPFAIFF